MRLPSPRQALRPVRSIFAAAILVAVASSAVAAQVVGKVVSDDGHPLADVSVDLWAGSRHFTAKSTGPDGAFSVGTANDTARAPWVLSVRRIGFRPVSLSVARNAAQLSVVLSPLPSMLEEVKVTADAAPPQDPCSRKPTAEASAIFARAASFYRDDTRWLDRIARYVRVVRATELANRDSMLGPAQRGGWTRNSGLYDGPSVSNSSAVPRWLSDAERAMLPFPKPEKKSDWRGTVIGWTFPRFAEWGTPSFVSKSFVDSMPKSVVSRGRQGIVLGFCPSDRRVPYTSGEIELGRDSTIIAIRWHFLLEKAEDDAGGLAIFAAPESKSTKAHLLPTNAVSWTRVPASKRFETTEYAYGHWFVAELGDSVRAIPPP